MLDVQVEPVALRGVRDDEPVAGQLLDAQEVVGPLRVSRSASSEISSGASVYPE
jgi:hypothetical protein